jgi:small subunit ribosomal protein S18
MEETTNQDNQQPVAATPAPADAPSPVTNEAPAPAAAPEQAPAAAPAPASASAPASTSSAPPARSYDRSDRPPSRYRDRGDRPGGGGGGDRGDRGSRDGDRRGGGRFRRPRRKVCAFCVDKITHIDYKEHGRLRNFVSDRGKILKSRQTGTCTKHQRALAGAIKRARHIALLPFVAD